MSAWTVGAVGALVYQNPALIPLLEEHLNDNDGVVLPHLLLSDIVRWMVQNESSEFTVVHSVMSWWGRAYNDGPEDVRELIVVSGVEMIPD
ncbi:hypothetical protein, partial [Microbacterium fluvii]|uniref:hypothetical protein n=1 Tax=Microbacterium fluvii TaxID=415215 RepID=UPI0031EAD61B